MEVNEKQKRILREISALLLSEPTETERLLLRPFRKTDLSELYEYLSQKEQQRLAGNPPVDSLDDAREVLDWILDPSRPSHSLAIVLRAENKVIGNLTLGKCPFLEDDEKLRALRGVALSYVLNERYWRKGYMTELLRAVYPILFEKGRLDYIQSGYFAFNTASAALQNKLGMRHWTDGVFECGLRAVEVMGRDTSVVSSNLACENVDTVIRSIIPAEYKPDASLPTVRFNFKPNKVFLFDPEMGERIAF